jgi:hypothetical protein
MARATARPGGIDPPCTDREPDNFAVATALSTIVSGMSISVDGTTCTDDIDWFAFTAPGSGTVTLRLTSTSGDSDFCL